jgi:hypothetical protein
VLRALIDSKAGDADCEAAIQSAEKALAELKASGK